LRWRSRAAKEFRIDRGAGNNAMKRRDMTAHASQGLELTNLPTKLCRICWNTHRWRRPTGEAALLEINSSVAEHGFGHEEWLFNFGYLIGGKHYAFLQPVGKSYANLQGQKVNLILYAVPPPPARPVIVARIEGCEVITPSEAQKVWAIYKRRGWLSEMSDQLEELGYKRKLENVKSTNLSNVRFSQAQVKFYDPHVSVPRQHKTRSLRRYQFYPLDPDYLALLNRSSNLHSGIINAKANLRVLGLLAREPYMILYMIVFRIGWTNYFDSGSVLLRLATNPGTWT